jgi:hypothetical protein
MPRAKRRIRLVHSGDAALTREIEWELCWWQGVNIAGIGLSRVEEFADHWERHRERILPRYIEAMPGSRPFAMYVCGEIAMPPITTKPYEHDVGRMIGSVVYHEARCYDELEHLRGLGIVGSVEARLAIKRLEAGSGFLYRWQAKPATF